MDQKSRHDVAESSARPQSRCWPGLSFSSEGSTGEEFATKFIQVNGRSNHFMTIRLRELGFCWVLATGLSQLLTVEPPSMATYFKANKRKSL